MKAVLLSIKPKWCDLIAAGCKTIEIRKSVPKISYPFKVYIYQTKSGSLDSADVAGCGKVIGEFICGEVFPIKVFENGSIQDYNWNHLERSCVPYEDISEYIGKDRIGYGWVISNLVIYDTYKELDEFFNCGYIDAKMKSIWYVDDDLWRVAKPPQSYMFVENYAHTVNLPKSTSAAKTKSEKEKLLEEYEALKDPAEQLNYYRNLHYKDEADSESYVIAWALDKILPELTRLRKDNKNGN